MEDGKVMNNLNILYEDNHIIVVEKPSNVLSQADNTKDLDLLSMVKNYIKEKYKKPGNVYLGLVHRLDRPVGGIMVFARTSKASKRLTEAFKTHDIVKKYLTICHGKWEKDLGTLIDKLERLENGNTIVSENGKEAILNYEVLSYNTKNDLSLVKIDLKTGRHHQIRVQLATHNHPICGDQRYGLQEKMPICLFAYYLEFNHPVTKQRLTFTLKPKKEGYWTMFIL